MEKVTITENLIATGLACATREEAIRHMADMLLNAGCVKPSFPQAVLDREVIYPTGLPFPIGVAIPHTDAEHVVYSAIAVGVLNQPVRFIEMGSDTGNEIDVRIVCMLAIQKAELIIPLLRELIKDFQNLDFLQKILGCATSKVLLALLEDNLQFLKENRK